MHVKEAKAVSVEFGRRWKLRVVLYSVNQLRQMRKKEQFQRYKGRVKTSKHNSENVEVETSDGDVSTIITTVECIENDADLENDNACVTTCISRQLNDNDDKENTDIINVKPANHDGGVRQKGPDCETNCNECFNSNNNRSHNTDDNLIDTTSINFSQCEDTVDKRDSMNTCDQSKTKAILGENGANKYENSNLREEADYKRDDMETCNQGKTKVNLHEKGADKCGNKNKNVTFSQEEANKIQGIRDSIISPDSGSEDEGMLPEAPFRPQVPLSEDPAIAEIETIAMSYFGWSAYRASLSEKVRSLLTLKNRTYKKDCRVWLYKSSCRKVDSAQNDIEAKDLIYGQIGCQTGDMMRNTSNNVNSLNVKSEMGAEQSIPSQKTVLPTTKCDFQICTPRFKYPYKKDGRRWLHKCSDKIKKPKDKSKVYLSGIKFKRSLCHEMSLRALRKNFKIAEACSENGNVNNMGKDLEELQNREESFLCDISHDDDDKENGLLQDRTVSGQKTHKSEILCSSSDEDEQLLVNNCMKPMKKVHIGATCHEFPDYNRHMNCNFRFPTGVFQNNGRFTEMSNNASSTHYITQDRLQNLTFHPPPGHLSLVGGLSKGIQPPGGPYMYHGQGAPGMGADCPMSMRMEVDEMIAQQVYEREVLMYEHEQRQQQHVHHNTPVIIETTDRFELYYLSL